MHRIIDGTKTHVDRTAIIWARATAARDNDPDVATLDEARPVISRVLDSSEQALLAIAETADGTAVAFGAIAPMPGEDSVAELHYLGVDPDHWGKGAAAELLAGIAALLRERGFDSAELAVYSDNDRAVQLYERLGWRRLGEPVPHERSGRPEQRYRLALRPTA
ncbi:GNAT family N-acetyltransferase [Aminobacter aminovorans]|uniref:GNAT family N-acetyltransferase n=1 Tax=Aminobacter aminovorans TaxID=83263 RepID=UPI00285605A5|nr:GNAT family N-acetyltransferase [Aminobacter aminovorans]MDR7223961.1 ribosomal protein S18 acetylase RimI-like enzyme [Aminobacter aminovorans]